MLHYRIIITCFVGIVLLQAPAFLKAQCDQTSSKCSSILQPYLPDGNYFYGSELFPNEKRSLKYNFLSNMQYRIVPCGVSDKGAPLVVNIFDKAGVLIYSSKDSPNSYFDISFNSTAQFTLVASFESGYGCAAILIGFLDKEKAAAILNQK